MSENAIRLGQKVDAFVKKWAPEDQRDPFWKDLRELLDSVVDFERKKEVVK